MKSYTDLDQSKKLAEILPLKSADMCYEVREDLDGYTTKTIYTPLMHTPYNDDYIPCWSLGVLLSVLSNGNMLVKTTNGEYYCLAEDVMTKHYDNPIDACVEIIICLNELNLL